jgi:1,2-phenylacetyl-CoA epoxidase PaaB subunit
LGHRREVYKPRKGKKKIAKPFVDSLNKEDNETAVQVALSHYARKENADAFAVSILAVSEALSYAYQNEWNRANEEFAAIGLAYAEQRIKQELTPFKREIVRDLVIKALDNELTGRPIG